MLQLNTHKIIEFHNDILQKLADVVLTLWLFCEFALLLYEQTC